MARQLFIRLEQSSDSRAVENDKTSEEALDETPAAWSPAFRASWLVLENGRPLGNIMRGDLSTALPLANGAQVVVTIPTEDILLLDVTLPGRNRKKLVNAVPYAVEDQLIDEVDELHFALSQQTVAGKYSVAVIDHQHMAGWQQVLSQAGLQAHAMVPDALALPHKDRAWTVFVDGERLLVRTGRYNGFASLATNMEILLQAALQEADKKPDFIELIVQSDDERVWPEKIDDITIVQDKYEQETLALLACDYDGQNAVNLMQGQYSHRENISKHVRPWYQAAALLLVWLVGQGGLSIYQGMHLEAESKALKKQMTQVYRSVFPGQKFVRNPYSEMMGQLRQLRKKSGKSQANLQDMLEATAPVLKNTKGISIKSLRFKSGRLELEFAVKDLQTLEDLKQRLSKSDEWKVEIQSASSRKDSVQTRMLIKSKAS